MNFMKFVAAGTLVFAASTAVSQAQAAQCGKISIAEMNWPSAELMANVDSIILKKGYGCDVTLIPGGTMTIFASMDEKGVPDVAPELWSNTVRGPLDKAVKAGRLHEILHGPITDLGEGWWVTHKFHKDHPKLDTVEKILKHPELFPYVEDPKKGAFMGCPAGWGCQINNANMFRAFKMKKKGWVLVDPGSGAGLDGSIAKAVQRGEPWFGYYWSPTALIGKYKLFKLKFETPWAGAKNWNDCISKPKQDCLNPKPTSWSKSSVETVVTDRLMKSKSPALGYFKKRIFPGKIMNKMLVYMSKNQASGNDAAYVFLQKYQNIWTKWVPADVAAKVKKAL